MEMHIDKLQSENSLSLRSPHLLKGRRGKDRKQVCEASVLPLVYKSLVTSHVSRVTSNVS